MGFERKTKMAAAMYDLHENTYDFMNVHDSKEVCGNCRPFVEIM